MENDLETVTQELATQKRRANRIYTVGGIVGMALIAWGAYAGVRSVEQGKLLAAQQTAAASEEKALVTRYDSLETAYAALFQVSDAKDSILTSLIAEKEALAQGFRTQARLRDESEEGNKDLYAKLDSLYLVLEKEWKKNDRLAAKSQQQEYAILELTRNAEILRRGK